MLEDATEKGKVQVGEKEEEEDTFRRAKAILVRVVLILLSSFWSLMCARRLSKLIFVLSKLPDSSISIESTNTSLAPVYVFCKVTISI